MQIIRLSISLMILFCFFAGCTSSKGGREDLYVDQTMHQSVSSVVAPTSNPYGLQAGFDQDPSGN